MSDFEILHDATLIVEKKALDQNYKMLFLRNEFSKIFEDLLRLALVTFSNLLAVTQTKMNSRVYSDSVNVNFKILPHYFR